MNTLFMLQAKTGVKAPVQKGREGAPNGLLEIAGGRPPMRYHLL